MTTPAIKIDGLWKEYVIGGSQASHDSFREMVTSALKRPFRRAAAEPEAERFWALQDINLELQQGDIVGIMGRNGAGKSTLLKILSRITEPTRGEVQIRGRVASLLEVGTGFHQELTGRENIYLNGAILGMRRAEIERKFDEIVAFADIGRFLDTQVKKYSSGMYVRLAFAVAAHLDFDILIVDEVLAVGDTEFQKKCLGKMGTLGSAGQTVLFVSHNLTALRNLCSKGVVMAHGRASTLREIDAAAREYLNSGESAPSSVEKQRAATSERPLVLRRARIVSGGAPGTVLRATRPFAVAVDVDVAEATEAGVFVHCYDSNRTMVFSGGSFFEGPLNGVRLPPGIHTFECEIPGNLLNDGDYTLDLMLVRNRREVLDKEQAALAFSIEDDFPRVSGWHWRPQGVVRAPLRWKLLPAADESKSTAGFRR